MGHARAMESVGAPHKIDSKQRYGDSFFAQPHPTIAQGIRKNVPWLSVGFLVGIALVSFLLPAALVDNPGQIECLINDEAGETEAPPGRLFQMIGVGNGLVFFIVMVVNGANTEFSLLLVVCVCALFGGINRNQIYAGLSSSAIIVLALLFPIVKAMADTGAPDIFMAKVMGNPGGIRSVLFRMIVAVTILGALFNNTPIVVMLTPMLFTFCQRLNFDARVTLMPLSFAAQAGGSITLVGSSINLTAQQVFGNSGQLPRYDIQFFTLSVGTIFVIALNCIYCVFAAPVILPEKKAPEVLPVADAAQPLVDERGRQSPAASVNDSIVAIQAGLGKKNLFNVMVIVQPSGPLNGSEVLATGIHRLSGIHLISKLLRPMQDSQTADEQGRVEELILDPLQGVSRCRVVAEGWDLVQQCVMEAGDLLQISATSDGVAKIRSVRGLELGNESTELHYLGAKRRERCLCEAAASADLVGQYIDPVEWKHRLRCGVVSVRSPQEPGFCKVTCKDYEVRPGDVILVEAFRDMVGSDEWNEHFGVVRVVPKSAPPRLGRKADMLRAVLTGTVLFGIFIAAAISSGFPDLKDKLHLEVTCMILLCMIIVIKGLTVSEAYSAVNGPILLIIAGAIALGSAMQDTRFANCMASGIVSAAKPAGTYALLAGIYLATAALGLVLNNAATVAIMGRIAISVSAENDIPLGQLALLVTFAASACFMTPYGYQTNTYVMDAAKYTWGDFIKFGVPLQLAHMVMIVLMAQWLEEVSPGTSYPRIQF